MPKKPKYRVIQKSVPHFIFIFKAHGTKKQSLFAMKVSTHNGNLFEVGENTVYHVAFD